MAVMRLPAAAGDQPVAQMRYTASRLATEPRIDGKTDDAVWAAVPFAQNFTQFSPDPGKPSRFRTEVKVAYNDDALFVAARMFDTVGKKISTVLTRRDALDNADYFLIGLDAFHDKQTGIRLGVTAAGVQVDMKVLPWCMDCNTFDVAWDAVWESAVSVDDNGWSAELRIPYSALRFPNKDEQTWGLQFSRYVTRVKEQSTWSPIDPAVNGLVSQWGDMDGVAHIHPPLRLSLSPYIAAYYERTPVSLDPVTMAQRKYLTGGLDLKYGLTESFTLDMTLVPDFGQVQSDNVVLNLGPFETEYEEHRPFFTEGTELFNKGNLFYSRRIGGTPQLYYDAPSLLNEGEELIANPSQVQLYNATKVSGRTAGGLGIGVLNAVAAPAFATARNASTGDTRRIQTDVLTNYNLLVLDQTLRNNSSVSFTNASTLRQGAARDANVSAFRFNARDRKNRYDFSGNVKTSYVTDPANASPSVGYAYGVGLSKVSGNFGFDLTHSVSNKRYDPNDLGIQFTNNDMNNFAGVRYNVYTPKHFYQSYSLSWGNDIQSRLVPRKLLYYHVNLGGDMTFKNFWYLNVFTQLSPESIDIYESRVGRSYIQPAYVYTSVLVQSDSRKRFSVSANGEWSESTNYHDALKAITLTPTLRIGDRFSIAHEALISQDRGNFGFLYMTSPDSIYFGRRVVDRVVNTFGLRFTLNPRASFTLRARHYWTRLTYTNTYFLNDDGSRADVPFVDGYDRNFNAVNLDAVFTWQFAPGSFMTVAWKNAAFQTDGESRFNYADNARHTWDTPKSNQLSVKMIYYLDYIKVRGWFRKR